jgi:arylsulfatase A
MKKILILLVFALSNICFLSASELPNIVYILVDDLGYGDLQCYNPGSKIPTPNMDQLAKQGMRFTDAHSGASVCSPSRYGLLTGKQFAREPWNRIGNNLNQSMIDADQLTVEEFLKSQGYTTACIGKWHLFQTWYDKENRPITSGPENGDLMSEETDYTKPTTDGPNDHGFDYFFGLHGASSSPPFTFMRNRNVVQLPTEKGRKNAPSAPGWDPSKILGTITNEALEYLDNRGLDKTKKPFFLYFPLTSIHVPITPGKDFQGKSNFGWYGDFVMETDWVVGQVMKKLEQYGLDNNTIVIFTSDNGSDGRANPGFIKPNYVGSVKSFYHHNMNGDWRGVKGDFYEGGHRVPFIIKWPGNIQPNTVNNEMIMIEDFYATIADILDQKLPSGVAEDSYSILPYLLGEKVEKPIRIYGVMNTFFGNDFIRSGDWVYAPFIGCGGPYGGNKSEDSIEVQKGIQGQLFNLKKDPQQKNNLWLERPNKVKELSEMLQKHIEQGHSFGIDR